MSSYAALCLHLGGSAGRSYMSKALCQQSRNYRRSSQLPRGLRFGRANKTGDSQPYCRALWEKLSERSTAEGRMLGRGHFHPSPSPSSSAPAYSHSFFRSQVKLYPSGNLPRLPQARFGASFLSQELTSPSSVWLTVIAPAPGIGLGHRGAQESFAGCKKEMRDFFILLVLPGLFDFDEETEGTLSKGAKWGSNIL